MARLDLVHWPASLPDLNRAWAKLHLNANERLRLYRKISKMLSNGLPLLKVLEELEMRASHNGRKPKEPLAIVLGDWRHAVQNGGMLAEGMVGWVPESEQMIILAGEQSGRIEAALLSVAGVVLSSRKIRRSIVGGVAYPSMVLAMIVCYVYLFGTRVIPRFAQFADPEHWQGAARSLYLLSGFVEHWLLPCVAVCLVLIALVAWSMPNWNGRLRTWLDRVPPYSIYRLVVGSGFLMAFASLQASGFTVEKSLLRLAANARPWLRLRIDDTLFGVKSGLNAGEAMRNAGYRFPSQEIVDDLCVYSEYNGFSEALKTIADEWLEDGVETIATHMRVLNGFAIVMLALVICWLITGFFGIQQEIAAVTRTFR
ncbi:type II secretion system F family protein [Trinickia fusca]|uniref:Type II secretion system protein F n=1 Tax=Trinickia fusca TaxID=2419777 RepID=A0A494X2K4_9BURK|nr:type II secretion system F family protein [Trinickia fusca]RKP44592.1 type II secretion system protein F [Trinickia fusca]